MLLFKCLGSEKFLKKLILLFSKDVLNWSKETVKTFIMLQILNVKYIKIEKLF